MRPLCDQPSWSKNQEQIKKTKKKRKFKENTIIINKEIEKKE